MRPPAESQSALRNTFNHILGSESNVRILRALCAASVPTGKGDLARKSKLSQSGVRKALKDLGKLGIVEEIGITRGKPVRLRTEHTLSGALQELFRGERARFDHIVEALREMVLAVDPPPRSAWIQGPVATGGDKPGDPIVLGVLVSARHAASARGQLVSSLPGFVRDPDVQVVPRIWTSADLEASTDIEKEMEGAILIIAPHPLQLLESRIGNRQGTSSDSHAQKDRRSLALASAIADRISDDPELIARASSFVRQRMKRASVHEQQELGEWLDLLEHKSVNQVLYVLLDPGERSTRLRQSLPFLDVLTEAERNEILRRASNEPQ